MRSFATTSRGRRWKRATQICGLGVGLAWPLSALATELTDTQVAAIVNTYAQSVVQLGHGVGVGVSVIRVGSPTATFAYGYANVATMTPFAADTLFEIASNTKVFTTTVLAKKVVQYTLTLGEPLSNFSAQVGALAPLSEQVTLKELADFTSGFPDLALCAIVGDTPGCLTSSRPDQTTYTAADFLKFFRHTTPTNYDVSPTAPLTALPGPYFYSNFSVGLLGLILATPVGPIGVSSVDDWYAIVKSHVLTPLGMNSTYLEIPSSVPSTQIALGYQSAVAEVSSLSPTGGLGAIMVTDAGGGYLSAPAVTISGGGGTGAAAKAVVANGVVSRVKVTNAGSGYLAHPNVTLNNGGSTTPAAVSAIVVAGQIVAFDVNSPGAGYTKAPKVTVTGGRASGGADATATAHIANGRVTAVTVDNGGAGYADPLAVMIAPGDGRTNVIPVWAAAGGLVSNLNDMSSFAAAAMGETVVAGEAVPPALTAAFALAQLPRACEAPNPSLATCPAASKQVGLAWEIIPADSANNSPEIITKNGALAGFSSQIVLVPSHNFALVVLVNSDDFIPAANLASQITQNLLLAGQ